jgi:hypothetical protein
MAKTNTIPSVQSVNNVDGSIANATGTGKITVWTAGANDAVLKSFGCSNTDTASHIVQVFVNIGGAGTDRLIGSLTVAASAGNDGATAAVDILRSGMVPWLSIDAYGNQVFNAKAGTTIKVSTTVAAASGKTIDFFGEGGDF